jgi:hypothetical protein
VLVLLLVLLLVLVLVLLVLVLLLLLPLQVDLGPVLQPLYCHSMVVSGSTALSFGGYNDKVATNPTLQIISAAAAAPSGRPGPCPAAPMPPQHGSIRQHRPHLRRL